MAYPAIEVTVLRPGNHIEKHILSLGKGGSDEYYAELVQSLHDYASDNLKTIDEIQKAQRFLLSSGYGLTNVILLSVSGIFMADLDEDYNDYKVGEYSKTND